MIANREEYRTGDAEEEPEAGGSAMSSTQERIKKRREYLKKKGTAYRNVSTQAVFVVLAVMLTIVSLLATIFSLLRLDLLSVLFFAALTALDGVMTRSVIDSARQAHEQAKQLPYVPPVTANSLPAEEVLVRGSEEPAEEQGKVLLRGTDGSAGTGKQELLRGSQRQDRE